jgi:hypothetical protein
LDEKMSFSEHVEVMVGKAFVMLGFIKRLSFELREPYTLKSLYTPLVRLKLEYVSCVWSPFYDLHVDKVESVQRQLYDLLCVVWIGRITTRQNGMFFFSFESNQIFLIDFDPLITNLISDFL